MATSVFQRGLEIFLEANELAGADNSVVTSFTDLSGWDRHLTAALNKPVIHAAAVNGKKSVKWNGAKNPLVWTGELNIRCGFLVFKNNGNFGASYQGILSTPEDFGILTGIGSTARFFDFAHPRFEYRLNDHIYPNTNYLAPTSRFGVIFFRFWENLVVDGIQLGQDRAFTDRKADCEIALLALYSRDFCESDIRKAHESIAYSYQIPLAKVFPFQGSKADPVTTGKKVLSDDQPEPVLRVKLGARDRFEFNFFDREQSEMQTARDFWKSNYPLKTFYYRDYNPTPPEDTLIRIPVPSEFERAGANNFWGYSFEGAESIVAPDYTVPVTATVIPNDDFSPPSVPVWIGVTGALPTQIGLQWQLPPDAADVNHYELRYKANAGAYSAPVSVGAGYDTIYNHTGLSPNVTYTYQLRSVDDHGNASAWSSEIFQTTPPEPFELRLNCGGGAVGDWIADTAYVAGGGSFTASGTYDTTGLTNPAPNDVYETVRYLGFNASATWTIPDLDNDATYLIRLHFGSTFFAGLEMDVSIEGVQVLNNYDPYTNGGVNSGATKARIKEFGNIAPSGGDITIVATGQNSGGNAYISGIEILIDDEGEGGGGG